MIQNFHGAKAAVFIGAQLLVYQRDSHVKWPDFWDFPGGGREGDETPDTCLGREVMEEFGLDVRRAETLWRKQVCDANDRSRVAWFFVIAFPEDTANDIRFGDEGQRWALKSPVDVANMPNVVPALRDRLTLWLRETGGVPI